MSRACCILALLTAFTFSPNSSEAGATVWMEIVEAHNSAGPFFVYQNGSPGNRAQLGATSGIITITVDLKANITDEQGVLATTNTNLVTGSDSIRVTEAKSVLPGPTAGPGANQIEGFGPGNILTAFGTGDFLVGLPTGDNQTLGTISFLIDWTDDAVGYLEVDGFIGANTWATLSGVGVDPVVFGDGGAGTNGANIGSYGGTFFDIVNVPEPSTLSVLGLGCLAMIRRRR